MSTDQLPKAVVREVPVGTEVIYVQAEGVFRYDGPSRNGAFNEVAFAYGQSGLHGLRCDLDQIAPKDAPIPQKADGRFEVEKRASGRYPAWCGPWLVRVGGKECGYFRLKGDATKKGLRVLAIADWHAAEQEVTKSS